jgi:limonene-1,2-epoxide hydrolase
MKTRQTFLLLSIFIAACTGNNLENIHKENIAVIEKYIQAVQSKDTKTMSDLLAENYIGYGPSFSDSTNKAQAIASWKEVAENLYDKIEYTRTVNIAAAVTEGRHAGNFVSDWAFLKITYKDGRGPVFLPMNAVYRIEDGKITMSRTFYNEADVLRQLGYDYVSLAK